MNILYISNSCNFNFGINSLRVNELLRFFSIKKINVTFISPQPGFYYPGINNIIVKNSSKESGKISLLYSNIVKSLFDESDSLYEENWIEDVNRYLLNNGQKLGNFDAILVNIHPICLVKSGILAKEIFNCKLIVDMQDPFYFNPYKRNFSLFDPIIKKKEEKLLSKVDGLIVCQKSTAAVYAGAYPEVEVLFVSNIHPSFMPEPLNILSNRPLKILYGGSLYIGRDLFPLLDVLKIVKNKFEIEVLGTVSILNKIRYGGYKKINWLKKLKTKDYYNYLNQCVDVGVVLQSFSIKKTGISAVASKTFEYLYLNKAIIYIGPEGDNADLVRKYSKNCFIMTNPKKDQKRLVKYLGEFKLTTNNTNKNYYSDFKADKIFNPIIKFIGEI